MAIGSTSYSDLKNEFRKNMHEMRQRNSLMDLLLLILSVSLMICSGFTHLMALNGFEDGLEWKSELLMAAIGGIYIAESFILISNFFYFRVRIVIIMAILIAVISLVVGIVRFAGSESYSFYVLFPLISDIIIIPSLSYSACTMDRNYMANGLSYVPLQNGDDEDDQRKRLVRIVANSKTHKRTVSETSDANSIIFNANFNTRGLNVEEDLSNTLQSSSKSGTLFSSKHSSLLGNRDEDDEKAEELVTAGMDKPGELIVGKTVDNI